jgi:hypothetical protein
MPITVNGTVVDDLGNSFESQVVRATVAVDPRTGAELWRVAGEANLWNDDKIMVVEWNADNSGADRFRTIRGSDGGTVWTYRPSTEVTTWTATGADALRPDRLVTATDSGDIEVRRFSDGSVVTAATLPWRTPTGPNSGYTQIFSSHDKLIVTSENAGKQTVTGYEPDTLRALWTTETSSFNSFFDCGELLCVSNGPRQVDALDPATGRTVWTGKDWEYARQMPDGRLITDLLGGVGWHGVVDSTTGGKIAELDPGTAYVDEITGTVLNVGTTPTTPGDATITQLTDRGEVVVRGSLGSITDNGCQLAADRLACSIGGGLLSVRDVR